MTSLYGPIDPLVTAPRYTDLDTVKTRLRIPLTNTAFDDRITAAIVTAELGIDFELGRSFPDAGLGLSAGLWVYEGTGAVPPGYGGLLRSGDIAVYANLSPLEGPNDADRDAVRYLLLTQPGGHRVLLAVTAITDVADYTAYTTTLDSGTWTGFVVGQPIIGQTLAAKGPQGIPEPIIAAATAIATTVYKMGDAPTGTAGADDMLGPLDITELVRSELRGNPMLRGFHVSWGLG
jgi:hypothetical protein